jgi:hypothetical protein
MLGHNADVKRSPYFHESEAVMHLSDVAANHG